MGAFVLLVFISLFFTAVKEIDISALLQEPGKICRYHKILPLDKKGNSYYVLFADGKR